MTASPPAGSARTEAIGWWYAGLLFCAFMLCLHVAAGVNSQGLPDFWRDFYWATAIAHGDARPLAGPPIYALFELGPWWFYLLALPVWLTASAAWTMAFVQLLAALKYLLAWRMGSLAIDARFGLCCAVGLAVAGWSTAGLIFPSHIALVETGVLLLAFAVRRCMRKPSLANGLLLGLACAACLHAHPTTLTYVVAACTTVFWRCRSRGALMALAVAGIVIAVSLLPPWLDRDAAVAAALRPVAGYVGHDVGVNALGRFAKVLWAIVAGGAWWGLLLNTPLKIGQARIAWGLYCACLLLVACGPLLLRGDALRWRRMFGIALFAWAGQVAFVIAVRPVTPVWMIPSCLPPLALAIAIGWYGWLASERTPAKSAGLAAFALYAVLAIAPFSLLLRDIRSLRVMPGVNPLFDVGSSSERFVKVAVPFYPLRRIDRLSASLCTPMVLHGRLAAVIEPTFGAPLRNACGRWPDLRLGGVEGPRAHLAGLLAPAAIASGIAPEQVISRMALYERVRPIAPAVGAALLPPRRLQVTPDSAPGPRAGSVYDFEAMGADAIVLTNRLSMAAPLQVDRVSADHRAARVRYDDGGSIVYACDACAPDRSVRWHLELHGIAANLDLIVLLHDAARDSKIR